MTTAETTDIDPQFAAFVAGLRGAGRQPFHLVSPDIARQQLAKAVAANGTRCEGLSTQDLSIEHERRRVPVRIHRPNCAVGTIVYLHGGGWMIGDLDSSAHLAETIALHVGAEVVSVDYRLAPENPYPAALEDARTVLGWTIASRGGAIAIVGDSAGGQLALAAVLTGPAVYRSRIAGLGLLYPVVDCVNRSASYAANSGPGHLLAAEDMEMFIEAYLPDPVQRTEAGASPLLSSDLSALPPVGISVAGHDPLHDEGAELARRLSRAGNPVRFWDYPTLGHGFAALYEAHPLATEAVSRVLDFIHGHIDAWRAVH